MANENTSRRGIYLPKYLDNWYSEQSESTGIKINSLMLEALKEYMEKNSKSEIEKNNEFKESVRLIIKEYLAENGAD